MYEGSLFLTSSPTRVTSCYLTTVILRVVRCCFIGLLCVTLMTRGVEHRLFSFGKMSIKVLCPFLSGLLSFFFFDTELHKLFIYFGYFSPLSDRSFANIFSSSGDLFSCFWWLPSLRFWMQFKLIKDLYWLKMPNGNVKIIFLVSMFWRTGSHAYFEDKPQGPMLKLFLVICDLGIGERDKLFCNLTCC